jgi:hypothetical protein
VAGGGEGEGTRERAEQQQIVLPVGNPPPFLIIAGQNGDRKPGAEQQGHGENGQAVRGEEHAGLGVGRGADECQGGEGRDDA